MEAYKHHGDKFKQPTYCLKEYREMDSLYSNDPFQFDL